MSAPDPGAPPRPWLDDHPAARIALLLLILAIGAIPRFANLTTASLWADELKSVVETSGNTHPLPLNTIIPRAPNWSDPRQAAPWTAVPTNLGLDDHPPLYFLLLRAWRAVFGAGDGAARALSAVASLAAIALFYRAVRLTSGTWNALAVALLLAVSEPQVRYAHEVRNYAVLSAACGAAAVCLLELARARRLLIWAAALAASALAVLFTHVFGALVLAALAIWSLIRLRGKTLALALAAPAAALVIFAVAWGPLWRQQVHNSGGLERIQETSPSALLALRGALAAPGFLLIDLPLRDRAAEPFSWAPFTFQLRLGFGLLVFCVIPLLLRRRRDLLLWWLWLVTVIGAMFVADLVLKIRLLQFLRQYLMAAPALMAVLVIAIAATLTRRLAVVATIGVAVACAAALPATEGNEKTDWRGAGAIMNARAAADEPVIVRTVSGVDPGLIYSFLGHYLTNANRPLLLFVDDAKPPLMGELCRAHGNRAWVLTWPDVPPPQEWSPAVQQTYAKGIGTWALLYEIRWDQSRAGRVP